MKEERPEGIILNTEISYTLPRPRLKPRCCKLFNAGWSFYTAALVGMVLMLAFWTLDPSFYGWYMNFWPGDKESGIFIRPIPSVEAYRRDPQAFLPDPTYTIYEVNPFAVLKISFRDPEMMPVKDFERLPFFSFSLFGNNYTFEQLETELAFNRYEEDSAKLTFPWEYVHPWRTGNLDVAIEIEGNTLRLVKHGDFMAVCDLLRQNGIQRLLVAVD